MKFIITGKNMDVTDAMKNKVEEKLTTLEKFFNKDVEVHVTFKVEKLEQVVEITIPLKGKMLRTEVKDHDMYTAIDKAEEVIGRQLVKYKSKLKDHHKKVGADKTPFVEGYITSDHENEEEIKIERRKKVEFRPMTEEEAVLQMELLGHDFFAFMNADTDAFAVVYKRKKNHYGLIEEA